MSNFLNTYNRDELIHYTFPALLSGAAALVAFMLLGHSPLVRALGLGLAIGAVTLTLRRFGAMLAITGGLAMAFSPAFWSQTGGQDSALLNLTAVVLGITAFVQVPIHSELSARGYDAIAIARLNANEPARAVATFAQAACDVAMLAIVLRART